MINFTPLCDNLTTRFWIIVTGLAQIANGLVIVCSLGLVTTDMVLRTARKVSQTRLG